MEVSSEVILFLNFVAYLTVFLCFLRKDKFKLCPQNVLYLWLAFSALSSFMFYIQPGYVYTAHYSKMTVFPLVYLFICLNALLLPTRKFERLEKKSAIKLLPAHRFNLIVKISLPFLIFLFLAYGQGLLLTNMLDMADVRADLYNSQTKFPMLTSWLPSTISRLYNQSYILFFCLSFYCLVFVQRKKWYHYLFIFLPYLNSFAFAFATATRSTLLFMIMFVVFQFFVYKPYMSVRKQKLIKKVLVVGGALFVLLLIAMSNARFADVDNASIFYYKYAGEAMINFDGLLFDKITGSCGGIAYFWYIPLKLGLVEQVASTLVERWNYIYQMTGVEGLYFYTIVGGFIIEFGKIATVFIIAFISVFFYILFSMKLNAVSIILMNWLVFILIQGTFVMPIQGDSGILSILWLILFYVWMKSKKNGAV